MSNWTDLVLIHGNEEGARRAFEKACEDVLRARYPALPVRSVRPDPGDGGVDVYIGQMGVGPIDVYQCKYFLRGVSDAQRQQIRDSFNATVGLPNVQLNSWNLCLPRELSLDESKWFDTWAAKQSPKPILITPAELMEWAQKTGREPFIFKRHDSLKLDWIVDQLRGTRVDPWPSMVAETESDCFDILLLLIRMHLGTLPAKPQNLVQYQALAMAGDRIAACQYIKSVLVGSLSENEKVWLFSLIDDFSLEPVAYKFIRRYDGLVNKAKELDRFEDLSTSSFYSVWSMLRSSAVSHLRTKAYWEVEFTTA